MPGARDKEIIISQAQWRAVRASPHFVDLTRLARATNALAMAYPVLMIRVEYQSPRARRDRTAAFLYVGGVLIEGLKVSRSLANSEQSMPIEQFIDLKRVSCNGCAIRLHFTSSARYSPRRSQSSK
jgi:hypothetical protein